MRCLLVRLCWFVDHNVVECASHACAHKHGLCTRVVFALSGRAQERGENSLQMKGMKQMLLLTSISASSVNRNEV